MENHAIYKSFTKQGIFYIIWIFISALTGQTK